MILRPYDVSQPLLMGEPDCAVDYFRVIERYAAPRFQALAKGAVHRMQRMDASGTFEEETRKIRSLWDEWCWYQHRYDNNCGMLSWGFEETLDAMLGGIVVELSDPEAELLTCAAAEDQDAMPARDDGLITDVLRELVTEAASRRSMARFEVW